MTSADLIAKAIELATLVASIVGVMVTRRFKKEQGQNLERLPESLDVIHAKLDMVTIPPPVGGEAVPSVVVTEVTAPHRKHGRVNTPPPFWPAKPGPKPGSGAL